MKLALALALLFVAATAPADVYQSLDLPLHATPERLLILQTGWRDGDAAVYVADRAEVGRLYSLLAGNARMPFTCGYHWDVIFALQDGRSVDVLINEECESFERHSEEIHRILHAYFDRALKKPRQWGVRVGIAADADPGAVRAALERAGYPTVALNPDSARRPSGEVLAKGEDERAAKAVLAPVIQRLVRERGAVVIDAPAQFMAGEGTVWLKAKLAFPFGTTRESVAAIAGARLGAFTIPKEYTIVAVSRAPFSVAVAQQIRAVDRRILSARR